MKYELMEICTNFRCDCHGGGWTVKKSNDIEELQKIIDTREEECCPECHEELTYEIYECD